jgi:hypothetical protein
MNRTLALLAAAFGAVAIAVATPAHADPNKPFKNCTQAKANGYCDIPQGSPMYTPSQDRDGDGYACEC